MEKYQIKNPSGEHVTREEGLCLAEGEVGERLGKAVGSSQASGLGLGWQKQRHQGNDERGKMWDRTDGRGQVS